MLFIAFTLISAISVLILAVWVERSAYEKEVASVREKHLIIARNLSAAFSRYVQDVENGFEHMISMVDLHLETKHFSSFLKNLDIDALFIVDASLNPIASLRPNQDET